MIQIRLQIKAGKTKMIVKNLMQTLQHVVKTMLMQLLCFNSVCKIRQRCEKISALLDGLCPQGCRTNTPVITHGGVLPWGFHLSIVSGGSK